MRHSIKVAVLGEGAWGTALATLFVKNGHTVTIWCHHPEMAEEINRTHINTRYMPGFELPKTLRATHDLAEAVRGVTYICEAVPVQYLRSVMTQLRPHVSPFQSWIIASKGIEQETLMMPSEIIAEVLAHKELPYTVLVGPTFAKDLMREESTGFLVAAEHDWARDEMHDFVSNAYVECMISEDTYGAQLCAAFKNVVALLVGFSDGQGHGDNARALLVTKCFQVLVQLMDAMGCSSETLYSLAGVGDMFLTASSTQSRNYQVGKALGAGESLDSIIKRTGFTPEGINTLRSMRTYAKNCGVRLDEILTIGSVRFEV